MFVKENPDRKKKKKTLRGMELKEKEAEKD